MPRVRLTAGKWLLAAALSVTAAGVPVLSTLAAPGAPGAVNRRDAAPAGRARQPDPETRRREEVDALQRQDAAEALKRHFNIDVDWRTTPLDRLIDIRVRAAKAADLQARLGVTVEWQRYSWIELEALRRTLLSFEAYRNGEPTPGAGSQQAAVTAPRPEVRAPSAADTLVQPTFKLRPAGRAGRTTDPDGIIRPRFTGRIDVPTETRDPDGVIRPTFAARPRWSSAGRDPDGLIAPKFLPERRFAPIADADELIDLTLPTLPTRTDGPRPAPARW
jgi:hypothetical protein